MNEVPRYDTRCTVRTECFPYAYVLWHALQRRDVLHNRRANGLGIQVAQDRRAFVLRYSGKITGGDEYVTTLGHYCHGYMSPNRKV